MLISDNVNYKFIRYCIFVGTLELFMLIDGLKNEDN